MAWETSPPVEKGNQMFLSRKAMITRKQAECMLQEKALTIAQKKEQKCCKRKRLATATSASAAPDGSNNDKNDD